MGRYPFMLWEAASRHNVLPLTSTCNLRCIFCSNAQNPGGVLTYDIPHLPRSLVAGLLPSLDPGRKIIIGEAATRINEGEPFTHPDIWQVLDTVRELYPNAMLQITTNGTLLDRRAVRRLARLQPLEVNLSLNSVTPAGRRLLMHDHDPRRAADALRHLAAAGVTFHGGLVAMPHLAGWGDLEATCRCLDDSGAATIRIFLPGFTRLAAPWLRFDPEATYRRLSLFVREQQERLQAPLILEPFLAGGGERLQAEIAGVVPGSPLARAGLQRGEVVGSVRGLQVYSRVDAFSKIRKFRNPVLELVKPGSGCDMIVSAPHLPHPEDGRPAASAGRPSGGWAGRPAPYRARGAPIRWMGRASGTPARIGAPGAWRPAEPRDGSSARRVPTANMRPGQDTRVLTISRGSAAGLVMRCDLDWRLVYRAARLIRHHEPVRVLVLTSVWGFPWLRLALPEWERVCGDLRLEAVPNRFFGGSIAAAGLLTTIDFGAVLRKIIRETGRDFDLVLLPAIAFDSRGRDLLGRSYTRLGALTRAAIRIV